MQIHWLGNAYIKITSEDKVVALYPSKQGLDKVPKFDSDLVLSDEHSDLGVLRGDSFVIESPGEYEIKDVFVYGVSDNEPDQKSQLVYRLELEGISLVHLGYASRDLGKKALGNLEGVDILILPVGGGPVLAPKTASKLVSYLEPRVVIPVFYQFQEKQKGLESVDVFIKETGIAKFRKEEKLKIFKKDLPQEETDLVLLEPLLS